MVLTDSRDLVSVPGDGPCNEDRAAVGDGWRFVLDGAAPYPGVPYGCTHTTAWLVDQLAKHLTAGLDTRADASLQTVLAGAITATRLEHGPGCDPDHPLALGSTVGIVRERGHALEWLVLADAAVVIEHYDGTIIPVVDDRVDHLAGPTTDTSVRTYTPSYVAAVRNQPGGFWVAGGRPEAARHAFSGQTILDQVRRVIVCTDGVSRLVDRYGWTWGDVLDSAARDGAASLVSAVRTAEETDPRPRRWRGKRHDDATAIYVAF